jgi:hypothetical protein
MSVSFQVYRICQDGQQELIRTTQSAREAREVRDTSQDETLVVARDDAAVEDKLRERTRKLETQCDIEGDYLI